MCSWERHSLLLPGTLSSHHAARLPWPSPSGWGHNSCSAHASSMKIPAENGIIQFTAHTGGQQKCMHGWVSTFFLSNTENDSWINYPYHNGYRCTKHIFIFLFSLERLFCTIKKEKHLDFNGHGRMALNLTIRFTFDNQIQIQGSVELHPCRDSKAG